MCIPWVALRTTPVDVTTNGGQHPNVPKGSGDKAVLIDFASTAPSVTGWQMGRHAGLNHAILPEDMAAGGEERLLDGYLAALKTARGPGAAEYPRDLALRHYRLGCVDYGRFVVGRFWSAGKTTPDSFAAKAASPNSGLWNRRVDAALAFAARINRYLAVFERGSAFLRCSTCACTVVC